MAILDLRQLWIFSKGLAHDFCIKFEIFTFDSFGKISLEIALSHPLVTKPAFFTLNFLFQIVAKFGFFERVGF